MAEDGWVPVNPRTLETQFPNVYAVGDIAQHRHAEGRRVRRGRRRGGRDRARSRASAAKATPKLYAGAGTCYIEFGGGRIGRVDVDFFSGPEAHRHLPRAERGHARGQGAVRRESQGALVRALMRVDSRRSCYSHPAPTRT